MGALARSLHPSAYRRIYRALSWQLERLWQMPAIGPAMQASLVFTTSDRQLSSDFYLRTFRSVPALFSRSLKGRAGTRLTAAVEVEAELAKVFRGKDAPVRR